MITGIDISEKNGLLNLDNWVAKDVRFAYIKASEALDSVDRCFKDNLSIAKENGLLTGAYHWLHPRLHVKQQAHFFTEVVGNFVGMLPPVVCLNTHRASLQQIERDVKTFLEILHKYTGSMPVIFTSIDYWDKYLPQAGWASEYPLWIDFPGGSFPPQIYPWAGWTFWQHTYEAKLPGILSDVGINFFNGNIEELKKMVIQ
jgi:lysozyme